MRIRYADRNVESTCQFDGVSEIAVVRNDQGLVNEATCRVIDEICAKVDIGTLFFLDDNAGAGNRVRSAPNFVVPHQ